MTLSPPARVLVFVAALALTGVAAVVFLLGRSAFGGEASTPPAPTTRATQTPVRVKTRARSTNVDVRSFVTRSGFPARVDRALRSRRVVVVAVYLPGAAVDAVVRREARAAASASRAGFVAISALAEQALTSLVAKTGVLPDPAVVVVKRPGVVAATFSVTDRETIAQAVAQARR